MPSASKQSASESVELEGYEGHFEHFPDGYTVGFETYTQDADLSRFAGRDETYEAGDAYYAPPGHTPVLFAGAEIVEFSPTEELQRTIDVVSKNMEAAGT